MIEDPWLLLIAGLPLLVGQIWAIVDAIRSDRTVARKVLWCLAIVVFHVVALAVYVIVRPPPRPTVSRAAPGSERAAALVDLVERRVRGDLTDDDYRRLAGELVQSP